MPLPRIAPVLLIAGSVLLSSCSTHSRSATDEPPAHVGDATSWPQFRGPGGRGVAPPQTLPTTWSEEENLVWKTPLPGPGTSSPVVFGDRVFVTCHTGYGVDKDDPGDMADLKRLVVCVDRRDGSVLWTREVESRLPESEYEKRMHWHGYASSTPAVDAERVYCFFGKSGVFAFDHDGNKLWSATVGDNAHGWGSAASPILYKDLVIVNAFVECGSLVALDKTTGEEKWRGGDLKESWNTPLLVDLPNGETELVVGIAGQVLGFDPATGEQLWSCAGPRWYIVASLVARGGVVFCIAGQKYEAVAVRAGGRGDVTDTHLVWHADYGSNVSSPVYYQGHLYFAHEKLGIAYCLDASTGELVYKERLPGRIGIIYASPIVGDGKLYYVSRQGGTVVLAAGPEFELLAHNRFADDPSVFNASPAACRDHLFLRSDRFLYCIGAE